MKEINLSELVKAWYNGNRNDVIIAIIQADRPHYGALFVRELLCGEDDLRTPGANEVMEANAFCNMLTARVLGY